MTYKEALHQSMLALAADPAVCFLGYGINPTGQGGTGTFAGVPPALLPK